MKQLRTALDASGYRQFHLFFGDANLRARDWLAAASVLKGQLRVLVSLFLLGKSIPLSVALPVIGSEAADALAKARIVTIAEKNISAGEYRLVVWRGFYYFCQLSPNPYAYFGEDSIALAQYQTSIQNGRVLDLCSGPGIQALNAASRGNEVTAVEQSADACRVWRVNMELNGMDHCARVVNQQLQDFAKETGEQWDQILFNPPLVPSITTSSVPTVWNGGYDGLDLVRVILEKFKKRLAPRGVMEFVGMSVLKEKASKEISPLFDAVRELGYSGRIHLLSRHAIGAPSMIFEAHAATTARVLNSGVHAGRTGLADAYRGYSDFYLFFANLQSSSRSKSEKIEILDMSKCHYGGWFA